MRVLAVDPGRDKCGLAVVDQGGDIAWRAVVRTAVLGIEVVRAAEAHAPDCVLLGNGTWSKRLKAGLEQRLGGAFHCLPPLAPLPEGRPVLLLVDEKHTTERARRLYFEHHPPTGLWKLVPLGLRVPPEPYDDFAAVVMARDFLQARQALE